MKITDSQYKDIIAKYFDYTFDFEFLDVVADTLGRIEDLELLDADNMYDEVLDAADAALTYNKDRWTVVKYYFSDPADLIGVDDVYEDFYSDIFKLIITIQDENKN